MLVIIPVLLRGENEGGLGKVKFTVKYKKLNDNTEEQKISLSFTVINANGRKVHSFNSPTSF